MRKEKEDEKFFLYNILFRVRVPSFLGRFSSAKIILLLVTLSRPVIHTSMYSPQDVQSSEDRQSRVLLIRSSSSSPKEKERNQLKGKGIFVREEKGRCFLSSFFFDPSMTMQLMSILCESDGDADDASLTLGILQLSF